PSDRLGCTLEPWPVCHCCPLPHPSPFRRPRKHPDQRLDELLDVGDHGYTFLPSCPGDRPEGPFTASPWGRPTPRRGLVPARRQRGRRAGTPPEVGYRSVPIPRGRWKRTGQVSALQAEPVYEPGGQAQPPEAKPDVALDDEEGSRCPAPGQREDRLQAARRRAARLRPGGPAGAGQTGG